MEDGEVNTILRGPKLEELLLEVKRGNWGLVEQQIASLLLSIRKKEGNLNLNDWDDLSRQLQSMGLK